MQASASRGLQRSTRREPASDVALAITALLGVILGGLVAGTNARYTLLSRRIRESEWFRAVSLLDEVGMETGWMQEYDGAAFYYRPDFNDAATPFRDIRDFAEDAPTA